MTLCVAIAIPSVRHDAIGAERNNRCTFGSGTFIRFHIRGAKMSEFRDSSEGTRSEASGSAFSRREEEQPCDRRACRRNAALGDEYARIATRLHFELDNVVSGDVTLKRCVRPSSKECTSCSNMQRKSVRRTRRHSIKVSLVPRDAYPRFIIKVRRRVRAEPAPFGAILYKSLGSRGIMPLAGSRGGAPWALPAGWQGWCPCVHGHNAMPNSSSMLTVS